LETITMTTTISEDVTNHLLVGAITEHDPLEIIKQDTDRAAIADELYMQRMYGTYERLRIVRSGCTLEARAHTLGRLNAS
jgi:hypothetical protein